jgi:hypothetical protein
LLQNKFGEREVARISDFEIEVVIRDEDDFAPEKLNG